MADPILSNLDLDQIKAQIANLDKADAEIRRAKSAGIDVSSQEQESKTARQQLLQIKNAYFPGQ